VIRGVRVPGVARRADRPRTRTRRGDDGRMTPVELRPVEGDREAFLPLLLEADDSEEMIRTYLKEGELLAVEVDGAAAGELLVIPEGVDTWEIRNIAIAEEHRGRGVGQRAIDLLAARAAASGIGRLLVGTADIAWETH